MNDAVGHRPRPVKDNTVKFFVNAAAYNKFRQRRGLSRLGRHDGLTRRWHKLDRLVLRARRHAPPRHGERQKPGKTDRAPGKAAVCDAVSAQTLHGRNRRKTEGRGRYSTSDNESFPTPEQERPASGAAHAQSFRANVATRSQKDGNCPAAVREREDRGNVMPRPP